MTWITIDADGRYREYPIHCLHPVVKWEYRPFHRYPWEGQCQICRVIVDLSDTLRLYKAFVEEGIIIDA